MKTFAEIFLVSALLLAAISIFWESPPSPPHRGDDRRVEELRIEE